MVLTFVISATWKAEIRRWQFKASPGKKESDTLFTSTRQACWHMFVISASGRHK
jgi:hypothetical protein